MQYGLVGHACIEGPTDTHLSPRSHVLSIDKKEEPNIALSLGRAVTQILGQSYLVSLALVLNSLFQSCLHVCNLSCCGIQCIQCELTFPPLQNVFSGKLIKVKKKKHIGGTKHRRKRKRREENAWRRHNFDIN